MTRIGITVDAGSTPAISTKLNKMQNVQQIADLVTKLVMCTGICICFGLFLNHCNLKSETIQQCKTACASFSSSMKKVTASSCICKDQDSFELDKKLPWN